MQTNERMSMSMLKPELGECRPGMHGTEADERSPDEAVVERGSVEGESQDDSSTMWFEC